VSDSYRAALERLVFLDGCAGETSPVWCKEWCDAMAAAQAALAKPDPLRKHCVEILQLWDADCDIDGAMEQLRGLLSEEVQA
jgi:hypothetical protein